MNINVDLIKEFAGFHKKFLELGALNTRIDSMSAEIQVRHTDLFGKENLQFAKRRSDIFPYEVFIMINGVKIFGVIDEEELYENFPEFKNELINELNSKVKYMEEDVQLDGGSGDDHAA
ncbi:MAG: hypothetical protein Q8934_22600 [Bacillota bacterium]|nr:hypothetical protein [Bacillota bacterium]